MRLLLQHFKVLMIDRDVPTIRFWLRHIPATHPQEALEKARHKYPNCDADAIEPDPIAASK